MSCEIAVEMLHHQIDFSTKQNKKGKQLGEESGDVYFKI